jgi:hypothetical protein
MYVSVPEHSKIDEPPASFVPLSSIPAVWHVARPHKWDKAVLIRTF